MRRHLFVCTVLATALGCSHGTNQHDDSAETIATTAPALTELLPGLWSKDSSGLITNEGFLLMPDGSLEGAGLQGGGNWHMEDTTGIVLKSGADTIHYRIIQLESERLQVESSTGKSIFRRVPFAMTEQPVVISGFAGNLNSKRPERDYPLSLPPSKLIELILQSDDPAIGITVFDGKRQISANGVKSWKSVIIEPNGIHARVTHERSASLAPGGSDYDLKVMGY